VLSLFCDARVALQSLMLFSVASMASPCGGLRGLAALIVASTRRSCLVSGGGVYAKSLISVVYW